MRPLNNKGIALITALMFTLISLTIIVGVLSMVTQGAKTGASMKVYRNAMEASYGGAEIVMNDVIPRLFNGTATSVIMADYNKASFNKFMTFPNSACINQKMNSANTGANWNQCTANNKSIDPKSEADMTFKLVGVSNQSFTVYSKIVDTIPGVPYVNTLSDGSQLMGAGVTEGSGGTTINLMHFIYRVEITGERTVGAAEQSNVSVLYEY